MSQDLRLTHSQLFMPVRSQVLADFAVARRHSGLSVADALEEALHDWTHKERVVDCDGAVAFQLARSLNGLQPVPQHLERVAEAVRQNDKYWKLPSVTRGDIEEGRFVPGPCVNDQALLADWPLLSRLVGSEPRGERVNIDSSVAEARLVNGEKRQRAGNTATRQANCVGNARVPHQFQLR